MLDLGAFGACQRVRGGCGLLAGYVTKSSLNEGNGWVAGGQRVASSTTRHSRQASPRKPHRATSSAHRPRRMIVTPPSRPVRSDRYLPTCSVTKTPHVAGIGPVLHQ